jgi:hypothetical protein
MTLFTPKGSPDRMLVAVGLIIFGIALFVCECVLLWFSYLREMHSFWLNSGGYPIFLRDMVSLFYYPMLILSMMGVVGLTMGALMNLRIPIAFICFEGLVIIACWALIIGSMTVSFSNNFENLWKGRPLHYKPQSASM